MPADRPYDVSSLTAAQLERAKRDLETSLALAFPGSPVRISIMAEMTAIDAELAERGGARQFTRAPARGRSWPMYPTHPHRTCPD
jgi:hypothetical protein